MTLVTYPTKLAPASPARPIRQINGVHPVSGRNLAHGHRTASQRAALAADLVLGRVRLERPTLKQTCELAGVSVPYAQAALRLSPEKREQIAAGRVSLCDAVRENGLLNAYRAATIKVKLGFARTAGPAQEEMNGRPPLDGALAVTVTAIFAIPLSWSKRKRAAAIAGSLPHVKAPDADNLLKITDALNGVVWVDDKQITRAVIVKQYGERPCLPRTPFGESSLVGLQVELPAGKCCGATVAEVHPGRGPHVHELRCHACGSHRGWLSRSAAIWLHSLIGKYGRPVRPINIAQHHKESDMSKFVLKPGFGQLFKNADKSKDTDRDYKGEAHIEGFGEVWLSGWKRTTKNGDPFLSLSIKAKDARPVSTKQTQLAPKVDVPF